PTASAAVTTAAAAISATVSTAAESAASAAAAVTNLGFRFVDFQLASVDFFAVKFGNSFFTFIGGRHFDKAETARAAGVTVFDNVGRFDCSDRTEKFGQVLIRCIKGKVSYVNFHNCSF